MTLSGFRFAASGLGIQGLFRKRSASLAGVLAMAGWMTLAGGAQTARFAGVQTVVGGGLGTPAGVAVDSNRTVYVVDRQTSVIHRYTPNSAGGFTPQSNVATVSGVPYAVDVDSAGIVYVTDTANNAVHRYSPDGSGGFTQLSDAVTGLNFPLGIAVDGGGTVYVADSNNNAVRRYTPNGLGGFTQQSDVVNTGLNSPVGIAIDKVGAVYVADRGNWAVHRYMPNGSGGYTQQTDVVNGTVHPLDVALDSNGVVYVGDDNAAEVIRYGPDGSGGYTSLGWTGKGPFTPLGVAVDAVGTLYISDLFSGGALQVKITGVDFSTVAVGATSAVQTLIFMLNTAGTIAAPAVLTQGAAGLDFADAGTGTCTTNGTTHHYVVHETCTVDVAFAPRFPGVRQGAVVLKDAGGNAIATAYVLGTGTGPQIGFTSPSAASVINVTGVGQGSPFQLALDGAGNMYVANYTGGTGSVQRLPAGGGPGTVVNTGSIVLNSVTGVAVDGAGNLFIADNSNSRIVVVGANGVAGVLSISGLSTTMGTPMSLALDGAGNLYFADNTRGRIMKVQIAASSLGTASPSGVGTEVNTGSVLGPGRLTGVAVDGLGNVYAANRTNVLKIAPGGNAAAVIANVPGGLSSPQGVAVDAAGDLFIADAGSNNRFVEVAPNGVASVVGLGSLTVDYPFGVTVDQNGNLLLADFNGWKLIRVDRVTPPSLDLGTGDVGSTRSGPTVVIENNGNADLSFPIPGSGNNPSISTDFTLNNESPGDCPLTGSTSGAPGVLASGESCTLPVNFTPKSPGTINGALVLTDNNLDASPSTTQTIRLTGFANPQLIVTLAIASTTLTTNHAVTPFTPVTATGGTPALSYSVAPALPAGLSMDTATGAITGTPTAPIAATSYTVTVEDALHAGGTQSFILTVTGVGTPTISFVPIGTRTYGDVPFAVSATSNSTGAMTYSVVSGPATIAGSTVTITAAGTVVLQVSQAATSSFVAGTAATSFNVAGLSPTISFAPIAGKTYGDAPFAVSATSNSTGVMTYSVVSGPATVSGGTVTITGTGMVVLQVSQAAAGSYAAAMATTSFNVTAPVPSVHFLPIAGKTYGDAPFAVSATSTSGGTVTYSVESGPATIAGSIVTVKGAGIVTLQANWTAQGGFAAATAVTSFVVAMAPLTLTANNANRFYGAPNPLFSGTLTGLKNNDSIPENFTTTAVVGSSPGLYAIVPSVSGSGTGNYTVTATKGTLTVTKAPTTTLLGLSSMSVNPNQTVTLTGTVAAALGNTSASPAGTVTFFDGGTALGTAPLVGSGGMFTVTLATGAHSVTAVYSGDANFLTSVSSVSGVAVTVAPSDFTITGPASRVTVVAGGSVTVGYTIAPTFGSYPGTVTLAVSGLPAQAKYTMSQSSLSANAGAQTVMLTVQTAKWPGHSREDAGWSVLLLLPLAGTRRIHRTVRTNRVLGRLLLTAMVITGGMGLAAMTGCGSGIVDVAPQDHAVTVTATSGAVQHTATITLTVQ